MQNLLFSLCLLVFSAQTGLAQVKKAEPISPENLQKMTLHEDTLAILGFTIINDSSADRRFRACHRFIPMLVGALKTENSFDFKFERLKTVSIQYPADSSFRIFTWQLFVDDSTYRYFGAIQMNEPGLKLFPLADRSDDLGDASREALSPEKWYGAIYYRLSQLDGRDGKKYLLYGFDGYGFFEKRKVLDVLSFQNGRPVFGAPIFNRGLVASRDVPEMRLILTYSAETSVKMNFDDEYGMILFDHLIPSANPFGTGQVMVPDGSYEGFKIEGDKLVYVEKLETQILDEAPRPVPILDGRSKKNILGGDKKLVKE